MPRRTRAGMLRAGTQARVRASARAALSLLPAPSDFGLPTSFGAAGKAESIRWWEWGQQFPMGQRMG